MTQRFRFLLVLCCLLAAGCITDSGDDEKNISIGLVASDYLPFTSGSSYNFMETTYFSSGAEPDTTTYTTTFNGPVIINGKSYFRQIDYYHEFFSDTSYVSVANNTMYMIETFWGEIVSKQADLTELDNDYITNDIEIPLIDFDAETWNIFSGTFISENHRSNHNWSGKYLRREDVTVPAGTFENAAVFEITKIEEIESLNQQNPLFESVQITITMWLAEDVGLVKSNENYMFYRDDSLVTQRTYITVLNPYIIP